MTDEKIISLYWERSQDAINETDKKYGNYCWSIAYGVLKNYEDAKECVNDTYLNLWNSIPPNRPDKLGLYIGRITKNNAINKYNYYLAKKRHHNMFYLQIDKQMNYTAHENDFDIIDTAIVINDVLNSFLKDLNKIDKMIFVYRYWYLYPIKKIAKINGLTDSYVKVSLFRSRNLLKSLLEKEGIR